MDGIVDAARALEAFNLLANDLPPSDKTTHTSQRSLSILDTFTCFPKLALELRCVIWQLTLPGRRVVDLVPPQYSNPSSTITPEPPVALFVNKESREVAMKDGPWSIFAFEYEDGLPDKRQNRPISLNPRIDILFVRMRRLTWGKSWNSKRQPMEEVIRMFSGVKCLEIHNIEWDSTSFSINIESEEPSNPFDESLLGWFRSLEKLILVATKERTYWRKCQIDQDFFNAVQFLQEWFDKKHKMDGRSVPEVILNYHRHPQALTDEERNVLNVPYPWLQPLAPLAPIVATNIVN